MVTAIATDEAAMIETSTEILRRTRQKQKQNKTKQNKPWVALHIFGMCDEGRQLNHGEGSEGASKHKEINNKRKKTKKTDGNGEVINSERLKTF